LIRDIDSIRLAVRPFWASVLPCTMHVSPNQYEVASANNSSAYRRREWLDGRKMMHQILSPRAVIMRRTK
jgi:hypothetical protein